jgi:hypothetical protein
MKAVEDRLMAECGPLRVVLIEDNPSAAMMVESMLAEDGNRDFKYTRCSTLATGLEAIVSTGAVAVLLDLGLAGSDGMKALDAVGGPQFSKCSNGSTARTISPGREPGWRYANGS